MTENLEQITTDIVVLRLIEEIIALKELVEKHDQQILILETNPSPIPDVELTKWNREGF